jgi:hypothetical protein
VLEGRPDRSPGLAWDWTEAALGAVYALPGAALILSDPSRGLALCFGVLPAAIIGLAPRRRGRLGLLAIGVLSGVPVFVGGLLAGVPVLAVAAIALLAVGAALLAARSRIGQVAMVLSLPMVGIGLSYADLGEAAGLAALMVAGSAFACLVSMLWPERAVNSPNADTNVIAPTLGYGIRLGAAGASAAAIGFLFNLDHVGWACAAALLVMRPTAEMQRSRSVGRILAVAAGAVLAIALVRLEPANGWYALAAIAALAGAAGTRRSRWYVTSAFTTFLVFLLLLYSDPGDAGSRFNERLVETVLGVGLAYFFGLVLPKLARSALPFANLDR